MNNQIIKGAELLPLIHNALSAKADPEGRVHLQRFTEKQMERYRFDSNKLGGNYGLVAEASANITLDFFTDSTLFGFNFDWTLAVEDCPWFSLDLYVDGVLYHHVKDSVARYRVFSALLPPGEKRIQLFLPWNQNVIINHLVLSEGASVRPAEKKALRILSFGDSITQGYISDHPSLSYIGCVTRKLNAEVLNQAVGGYYFDEASLDDALAAWTPDLITVAYGINDYTLFPDPEEFRSRCSAYLRRLTEIFPLTKLLVILPIYTCNERFRQKQLVWQYSLQSALETLRQACRQNPNVSFLEDNFYPRTKDFFAPDELHPNDLGFSFYGDAVIEKIRGLLQFGAD